MRILKTQLPRIHYSGSFDQELEESHGHELIDQIVKISRNPHIQRFYINY